MFRKTKTEKQLSLQSNVAQYISKSAYKNFSDPTAWHSLFFEQVTNRIDENMFSSLYSDKMGAPNSSIKILISMMILKEGHGWSDHELFENCHFNLLVRKSLGILNLEEQIPSESTYYLFRNRLMEHCKKHNEDLFEKTFKHITKTQILQFNVSGKSVRMDSKLIGSNIAFFSRYEIIHRALCLYYKSIESKNLTALSESELLQLQEVVKEQSTKTVYRSTKEQIKERMQSIGTLIYKVTALIPETENEDYKTLKRIFEEQYKITDHQQIELRPKEEISANSVQSPYDTDCSFRNKNGESTKGYSHNVAETCDKDSLNLITNVQTKPATAQDNGFVEPALENSQEILIDNIKNLHTDGAYNGTESQEYTKEHGINFYLTGLQGKQGRYDLLFIENDQLQVIDIVTGETQIAQKVKEDKYKIKVEKANRYFTKKQIESCYKRRQINELPSEIKDKRNNVESTIFHLAYPLRKDKTKYRGLFKNTIWATLRCLWINLSRIVKYVTKVCQRTKSNVNFSLLVNWFLIIVISIFKLTCLELIVSRKNNKINLVCFY